MYFTFLLGYNILCYLYYISPRATFQLLFIMWKVAIYRAINWLIIARYFLNFLIYRATEFELSSDNLSKKKNYAMFLTGHRGFHFPQRRLYRSIIAKRRAAQGAVGRGYPASRDPSIFYLGRSRGLCSEGRKRHEWHIVQSSDETASTFWRLVGGSQRVNRQKCRLTVKEFQGILNLPISAYLWT